MGLYQTGPGPYDSIIFAANQCKPAVIIIANEYKAVADARACGSDIYLVYRETGKDDGINGDKARQLLPDYRAKAPAANAYSIANECVPQDGAAAIAARMYGYIEAANVAAGLGLKITGGNLNTGFPLLTRANLDAMTPALQHFARLGMPWALHVYNDGVPNANDLAVFHALADRAPGLKFIIEEYGLLNNRMVTGTAFDAFLGLDDLLDNRIIGVALFTLGGGQWAGCDYTTQLPRLIEHVQRWR